jgi:hypothetical protein
MLGRHERRREQRMQKWEYLIVNAGFNKAGHPTDISASDGRTFPRGKPIANFLNQLGEEAWELVGVAFGTSGHDEYGNALMTIHDFYFKRAVTPLQCKT